MLSIGAGTLSRIYKKTIAESTWVCQFANADPAVFLDAVAELGRGAWHRRQRLRRGRVPHRRRRGRRRRGVDGVPADRLPPALDNEGAFAASGTNVTVFGRDHVWFGTGAAARARVLQSADRGRTWAIADTPLLAGSSAGIYSVAFRDALHGVIVGGDYAKEAEAVDNVATTADGGRTWTLVRERGLGGLGSGGRPPARQSRVVSGRGPARMRCLAERRPRVVTNRRAGL